VTRRKRRKILLLCYGIPIGGAEIYMGRLAQLLHGYAEFCALCGNEELATFLAKSGVRVFSYVPVLNWEYWWRFEYLLVCSVMLPYLRLRYGIDTIWIQGFREAMVLPWARVLGYTTIATMHNTLTRSISQAFYPYLILSAHKVICVSKSVAESLPAMVPRRKSAVVQNWVSSVPKPVRRHSNGSPLRMLYVGRLVKYKGASLIFDAMRELNSKGKGHRVSLIVVGEGSYRSKLERLAEGLDVQFAGFHRDPSRAYQDADLFINPTLGPEGLSLVSLEAMAHGLPCILSDLGVNKELTADGKYALLFRLGDASDLCAKIEMCLTSPGLLERYGQLAMSVAASRHNSDFARARYIEEIGL
jgi:glycosyltransferase involved in cell wall biosynthesis